MDILLSYIIKSFIASGILYLYYLLALKNKKFHTYNRYYLLLSIIISLVIPFLNLKWLYIEASNKPALTTIVNTINAPVAGEPVNVFNTGSVLLGISIFVSTVLLLFLVSRIIWIYAIKRKSRISKMQGFTLIETKVKQAPFSFLNNLFWKQGLSATDDNGSKIFRHELTHIFQKHSYDRLFTQIVFCIFWMNPFYWLIQKELNTIHEFIADAASVEDGDTESFARMLLHAHNEGSYLSPSHRFFNSSIKRRLVMISTSNHTPYSYTRRILALPIILFVLAVLSISVNAQSEKIPPIKESAKPVTDTIPKSAAPVSTDLKPVTVTGYKLNNNSNIQPVKVKGQKLNKNVDAETTIVTAENINSNSNIEPVTVTGHKLSKMSDLTPVTVPVEKSEAKPIETVTVIGQKLEKTVELTPITVTGQKSGLKPIPETIKPYGMDSERSPELSPKKPVGKKTEKKPKKDTKPESGKKLD